MSDKNGADNLNNNSGCPESKKKKQGSISVIQDTVNQLSELNKVQSALLKNLQKEISLYKKI